MSPIINRIVATLIVGAVASVAEAQVPPRPGLMVAPPVGGQPSAAPQTGSPIAQPGSTQLVQRQFDPVTGQPAPAGQQPFTPQGAAQDGGEFFYVRDGSEGPEQFAGDLSTHNEQIMAQTGAQLRGDYGDMSRDTMPAGRTQEAWNRPFDNMSDGQTAPGVVRYQWTADLVMPVRLRAGFVTNIVLPEWDAAEDILIGDGATVEATIVRANVIAVKSVQTGVDTSLSIISGSGNVYTMYLRTEGRNTRLVTDLQVFIQAAPSSGDGRWFNDERRSILGRSSGGQVQDVVPASAKTEDASLSMYGNASNGDEPVPVDRRVFDIKMYEVNPGDQSIAPDYVYTDGRFTYLHFPAGVTDRPAVFRSVDGVEGRVNTRVMGRYSEIIVVEALGDFVLRSGSRTVCLVRGAGDRAAIKAGG